ncbi:4-(cytidine 5'-diphospho)-2-C-methyl-D-erythritol kinase [bacterium]|nr:4-(cytidine 5'-diphospho)-2-C-methyl-D-erythritol kinase [bacterium]
MISTIYSPAKINIFLKIEGRDKASGMHFLRSLFAPIDICDKLEIEESSSFSVATNGIAEEIPTEKNIVFKAYSALRTYIGKELPEFSVKIEKSIPTGAGLGGGSSNAAAFLKFVNEKCKLDLSLTQLIEIASKIGSDVPFFILGKPAIVSGTGEKIETVELPESGKFFVLVNPEIHVDTKLAYSLFDKTYPACDTKNRVPGHFSWKNEDIFNDFEEIVFSEFPGIAEVKTELETLGAHKVFMSGSGSTLVAMTENEETARKIVAEFSKKFKTVRRITTTTCK